MGAIFPPVSRQAMQPSRQLPPPKAQHMWPVRPLEHCQQVAIGRVSSLLSSPWVNTPVWSPLTRRNEASKQGKTPGFLLSLVAAPFSCSLPFACLNACMHGCICSLCMLRKALHRRVACQPSFTFCVTGSHTCCRVWRSEDNFRESRFSLCSI